MAVVGVRPTLSGPSATSLAAGILSILVAFVALFFGQVGGDDGWGVRVAGAFAILAGFLGVAALVLAGIGMRQVGRRAVVKVSGLAVARAGLVCAVAGLVGTAGAMLAAVTASAA